MQQEKLRSFISSFISQYTDTEQGKVLDILVILGLNRLKTRNILTQYDNHPSLSQLQHLIKEEHEDIFHLIMTYYNGINRSSGIGEQQCSNLSLELLQEQMRRLEAKLSSTIAYSQQQLNCDRPIVFQEDLIPTGNAEEAFVSDNAGVQYKHKQQHAYTCTKSCTSATTSAVKYPSWWGHSQQHRQAAEDEDEWRFPVRMVDEYIQTTNSSTATGSATRNHGGGRIKALVHESHVNNDRLNFLTDDYMLRGLRKVNKKHTTTAHHDEDGEGRGPIFLSFSPPLKQRKSPRRPAERKSSPISKNIRNTKLEKTENDSMNIDEFLDESARNSPVPSNFLTVVDEFMRDEEFLQCLDFSN